jgi:hypothetical protein
MKMDLLCLRPTFTATLKENRNTKYTKVTKHTKGMGRSIIHFVCLEYFVCFVFVVHFHRFGRNVLHGGLWNFTHPLKCAFKPPLNTFDKLGPACPGAHVYEHLHLQCQGSLRKTHDASQDQSGQFFLLRFHPRHVPDPPVSSASRFMLHPPFSISDADSIHNALSSCLFAVVWREFSILVSFSPVIITATFQWNTRIISMDAKLSGIPSSFELVRPFH